MITPRWVRTKCQPIAIRDVLVYLTGVLEDHETFDRVLEIGGPDVVTYAEMMQTYAQVAGLPRGSSCPCLSLAQSLVAVGRVGHPAPHPDRRPPDRFASVRGGDDGSRDRSSRAPRAARFQGVVEPPCDSPAPRRSTRGGQTPGSRRPTPSPGIPSGRGSLVEDHQTVQSGATSTALYEAFARIGGEHGYYVSNWAWSIRGLADKSSADPGTDGAASTIQCTCDRVMP